MKGGGEEEGEVDAAITDDGSGKGHEEADGEHAGEGEEEAGGGEGGCRPGCGGGCRAGFRDGRRAGFRGKGIAAASGRRGRWDRMTYIAANRTISQTEDNSTEKAR